MIRPEVDGAPKRDRSGADCEVGTSVPGWRLCPASRSWSRPRTAAALAEDMMRGVPLPERATADAVHVPIAAVHGVDLLLTWNCTHIANATLRPWIEAICRAAG